METWIKIHTFIAENEVVQVILIYVLVEIGKRLFPTKDPRSMTEIIGGAVRKAFDKTHLPNRVKVAGTEGEKEVVDANPKNTETKP